MKNALPICALFLAGVLFGCAYVPRDLAARYGWKVERIGDADFRLTAVQPGGDRDLEALAVAGDVVAAAGFRSFIMVADPERPDSGSSFEWGQSYGGGPGICVWRIGSSFRVRGHHESAKGKRLWDSRWRVAEFLENIQAPNQPPEPASGLAPGPGSS